ncbi:type III restriction endonuclease subunit M [Ilumatobacter sp.]|uniref:type III restriction endonuclease subunit M n=1 Tax=Ilumatobacter sp. TaxID=1967498 RepID=UPI003B52CCFD
MTSTTTDERQQADERRSRRMGREQIKSRDRVRDLAEVYTHEREVDAMLAFVPDMFESIESTFLEPACGNGNFLVEILGRKLASIDEQRHGASENLFDVAVLRAAASIYAIDISDENVAEAHERMTEVVASEFERRRRTPTPAFGSALASILGANVICGDALNGASEISFFEWKVVDGESFTRTPFSLEEPEFDLFFVPPEPLAPIHYTDLGRDDTR